MTRSRDLANLADSTEFTAADNTKLDGIEASATADQTNAQIKTAVEAGADIALGGNPTTTTQSAGNNTTRVATTAFTQAAITALVGSVPATLNTLAELGDALGDDPNYATTTSNLIGTKMPLAGGAFTGAVTTNSTFDGVDIATRDAVLTTTTNTANAALPKAGGTVTGDLTTAADASITIQGTHNEGGGLLDLKGTDTPASGKNLGQVSFGNSTDPRLAMIRGVSTAADAAELAFFTEATGASIERRMTILSTGNVGIGTSSPNAPTAIVANTTTYEGLELVTPAGDASGEFHIGVHDNGGTAGRNIVFKRGGSDGMDTESMRIDGSGNLLVGTTATGSGALGFRYRADLKAISAVADGQIAAYFGRRSSDGEILRFRKNDADVGSIFTGHGGSQVGIGTNTTGITFNPSTRSVMPANPSSANPQLDATIDLGYSTVRFRDIYLSGGVLLGGTGTPNKLDDYEEGTWSPVIQGLGGNNASMTVSAAKYTKVGRLCNVTFYAHSINFGAITSGNHLVLSGLPFPATAYADFTISYRTGGWTSTDAITGGYVQSSQSIAYFVTTQGSEPTQTSNAAFTKCMINITYMTT